MSIPEWSFPHHRLLMVMGPGGVGKTTCSAALALAAALLEKRTLVCTLDPARRLATSLGLGSLSSEPAPLPAKALKRAGLPVDLKLEAMMLDVKAALERTIAREIDDPELAARIGSNRFFRHVADDLAGVQRYAAISQVLSLLEEGQRDLIVLDTPQTQHVLELMQAPYRVLSALDSTLLRWIVKGYTSAGRFSLNLFSVGRRKVVQRLAQVVGGGFLAELAEFMALLDSLMSTMKEKAARASASLRSEETGYLVVSDPAPLRVDEAILLLDQIRSDGMVVAGFVLNRFHRAEEKPGPPPDAKLLAEKLSKHEALVSLDRDDVERAARLLIDVHRDFEQMARSDKTQLHRVRTSLPEGVPWFTIEMMDRSLTDLVDLKRVAERMAAACQAPSKEKGT